MAERAERNDGRDRIGRILCILYMLSLAAAAVVVAALFYVQFLFHPEEKITEQLTPGVTKDVIAPVRGAILARDGRMLATSYTSYTIAMDPSVMKDSYANDSRSGKEKEQEWRVKARQLSQGLTKFFPEKTADEYYNLIIRDREQGKRYRSLGHAVGYETLQQIKALPLFNEGQYRGGIIVSQKEVRQYPYGKLARRTIGFVRDNTEASSNNYIGIEGKFDYKLHGTAGYTYLKPTDGRRKVMSFDSLAVKAKDGMDVRTTLDVDIQDLADRALRSQIDSNRKIEGGCAVVMEVKTGAIRAMVNLKRDPQTRLLEESINYAVGRAGEPGSVFKASTIMTLIEDGHVKSLDDMIPTNRGVIPGLPPDAHISDWEREHKTKEISILDGLKMSSNYVFAYLATQNYSKRPKDFIDKLYTYKLGEAFDFDLDGMATPAVPDPDNKNSWSNTSLGTTAYGYSVTETPLHILTFYNAIANRGKMMKPYLVEGFEENGAMKEKRGPSILNAAICSRATADTLTRGLSAVVREGTATRLKNAKCAVAGKTGTARIVLDASDSKTRAGQYSDEWGRKKNQATFVGFFPADAPQYSLIVVVYSILDSESFYGGTLPALAAREIVDGIWAMDPAWREEIPAAGVIPVMSSQMTAAAAAADIMPDLSGMGLKDALYAIENAGMRCSYSGIGHVASQTPKAGSIIKEGETVKITLK